MRLDLDIKLSSLDKQTDRGWVNVRFGDGQSLRLPVMNDAKLGNIPKNNTIPKEVCEKVSNERLAS